MSDPRWFTALVLALCLAGIGVCAALEPRREAEANQTWEALAHAVHAQMGIGRLCDAVQLEVLPDFARSLEWAKDGRWLCPLENAGSIKAWTSLLGKSPGVPGPGKPWGDVLPALNAMRPGLAASTEESRAVYRQAYDDLSFVLELRRMLTNFALGTGALLLLLLLTSPKRREDSPANPAKP